MRHFLLATLLLLPIFSPSASAEPARRLNQEQAWQLQRGVQLQNQGQALVPMDFQKLRVAIDINRANSTAKALATLEFQVVQPGFAYFDFLPLHESVRLYRSPNAAPENVGLTTVVDPTGLEIGRALDVSLTPGAYKLEVSYAMGSIEWLPGDGLQFHPAMTDLTPRNYLEKYAPSSGLHDQFEFGFDLRIRGVPAQPALYTNGTQSVQREPGGDVVVRVDYPAHYNSTCPYFMLTTRAVTEVRGNYVSPANDIFPNDRNISLVFFNYDGNGTAVLDRALAETQRNMQIYEQKIGPYAHPAFLGFIPAQRGGGMEYAGATDSSLGALSHELFHSWFGRGILAGADGGWIDEAFATWNDRDMPSVSEDTLGFTHTTLAGVAPEYRMTVGESYGYGSQFLAILSGIYGPEFLPIVQSLYRSFFLKPISTADFFRHFLARTRPEQAANVRSLFNDYIYGADCRVFRGSKSVPVRDVTFVSTDGAVLLQPELNDKSCFGDPVMVDTVDATSLKGVPVRKVGNAYEYRPPVGFSGDDTVTYRVAHSNVQGVIRVFVLPNRPAQPVTEPELRAGTFAASYFDLTSTPAPTVDDLVGLTPAVTTDFGPALVFDTERALPGSGGLSDQVGLRVVGYFSAATRSLYQFAAGADDDARVYVDDDLVTEADRVPARPGYSGLVSLEPGFHKIEVRYIERSGPAVLNVRYRKFATAGYAELGPASNVGFTDFTATEAWQKVGP